MPVHSAPWCGGGAWPASGYLTIYMYRCARWKSACQARQIFVDNGTDWTTGCRVFTFRSISALFGFFLRVHARLGSAPAVPACGSQTQVSILLRSYRQAGLQKPAGKQVAPVLAGSEREDVNRPTNGPKTDMEKGSSAPVRSAHQTMHGLILFDRHIEKNAGTSFRSLLVQNEAQGHCLYWGHMQACP